MNCPLFWTLMSTHRQCCLTHPIQGISCGTSSYRMLVRPQLAQPLWSHRKDSRKAIGRAVCLHKARCSSERGMVVGEVGSAGGAQVVLVQHAPSLLPLAENTSQEPCRQHAHRGTITAEAVSVPSVPCLQASPLLVATVPKPSVVSSRSTPFYLL